MNTCIELGLPFRTIVLYSHLIPVAISLVLVVFVLAKSRRSLLSILFTLFVGGFCLWLLGDIVLWGTVPNYHLFTFIWSLMDYVNILFYLGAVYFFLALIRGGDISLWQKLTLFALSIPAWWLTFTGQSVVDFYQPWCEATNNEWLTQYKLGVEILALAFIMLSAVFAVFKDSAKRKQILIVAAALVLFLATFASTEYISSVTGVYEINLYSLFVLPLFLLMIIFSITNLKIFAFRSFGTQLLIYVLLIMVGSQFFFLQNTTYRILTVATFALSFFIGVLLVRNIRREEELAIALQVANEGQANLLHILNHQIKGYLTKARITFDALLTDSDYGPVSAPAKDIIKKGYDDVTEGANFVQDFLTASNIEKGTFTYTMSPMDLKEVVEKVSKGQEEAAQQKGLSYELSIDPGGYLLKGDKGQMEQVIRNLIDNSIKYTPTGSIKVRLERKDEKILFSIHDTGVGISDEVKPKLFTKGGRDKDSIKINTNSTGFGLAFVKGVVVAHNGRVWAESPGQGRGSVFYLELPALS